MQNMFRNWKKGLIVMVSMALSLVVVNCIVILVQGYDFDSYKKVFMAADFQLDQMTGNLQNTNFNGINPSAKETLDGCPYSEHTGYVYYSDEKHKMEPQLLAVLEENAKRYEEYWSDYEKELWKEVKASGMVAVHFLGISEAIFEKLEWKETSCSWEDFQTGNYVIVDYHEKYAKHPTSYYRPCDEFLMEYQNGRSKEYKVLGEALMPYALDYPYADIFYITVMVPESEYIKQTGNASAMYAAVDAKKGQEEQVKKYIQDTVQKENEMLNVCSVLDMRESFQRYVSKYYMVGGCLVVVLALIGIMNFINTTAASVVSRKKELALLEVVGMTKSQIVRMLVAEGCIYLGGAFAIAVLIVCFCAEKLLANTLGMAFFFQMHLTVLPCVAMLPLLLVTAYVIPRYQFRRMSRESVVERIRSN